MRCSRCLLSAAPSGAAPKYMPLASIMKYKSGPGKEANTARAIAAMKLVRGEPEKYERKTTATYAELAEEWRVVRQAMPVPFPEEIERLIKRGYPDWLVKQLTTGEYGAFLLPDGTPNYDALEKGWAISFLDKELIDHIRCKANRQKKLAVFKQGTPVGSLSPKTNWADWYGSIVDREVLEEIRIRIDRLAALDTTSDLVAVTKEERLYSQATKDQYLDNIAAHLPKLRRMVLHMRKFYLLDLKIRNNDIEEEEIADWIPEARDEIEIEIDLGYQDVYEQEDAWTPSVAELEPTFEQYSDALTKTHTHRRWEPTLPEACWELLMAASADEKAGLTALAKPPPSLDAVVVEKAIDADVEERVRAMVAGSRASESKKGDAPDAKKKDEGGAVATASAELDLIPTTQDTPGLQMLLMEACGPDYVERFEKNYAAYKAKKASEKTAAH